MRGQSPKVSLFQTLPLTFRTRIRKARVCEWASACRHPFLTKFNSKEWAMAKPATIKIKLVSTADTGFFYVTKKNPRNITEKMTFRKYDPVVRKHVEFKEAKIK